MNKATKFIIGGVAAFGLNIFLSNMFGGKTEKQPVTPTKDPEPTPVANINLLLQKGSKGYEVYLLQKKLGIPTDGVNYGIFGSQTETALFNATGVRLITLKAYDTVLAAYQAQKSALSTKAQIEKSFPISKQVIALTDFFAAVAVYRNGNWFTTDLDGKQLPGATFKASAQVGAVYSYDYNDPTLIIIALPYQVPHNVYNIPANQTYNKIRVKAAWIK